MLCLSGGVCSCKAVTHARCFAWGYLVSIVLWSLAFLLYVLFSPTLIRGTSRGLVPPYSWHLETPPCVIPRVSSLPLVCWASLWRLWQYLMRQEIEFAIQYLRVNLCLKPCPTYLTVRALTFSKSHFGTL